MKLTKTIKKMAIASLFGTAVLAVFSACGGGNSDLNELEAPKNLRLENEYLCWDNIEGAEEYLVEINGEEYTSKENKFDIFYITDHNQRYDMRVMAYGDAENTSDSNWSDFFIYDVDSNNGGWEFKYNKDKTECTVTVTDKDKIKGKMIVPEDDCNGVPVTKIDNFSFCKNLTSIILPDTLYVTQVAGGYFFWGCESLERVKLPDRMDKIPGVAFNDCKSLYEIDIPESIQNIDGSLFSGCTSLKEVTFHDGLKALGWKLGNYVIEYYLDYNNNEYLSLSPNSEGIFEGCKSLAKIVVPKTVESITANLFRGVNCEIEIDEENPYFYYDGGYLIRRDGNEIIYAKDKT
ncbi:MAG: leucine-rich repeat domain-containing protein, partial [Clostridia bacterium]|nr:leucine-rich repeat domain-containing protein [Clostridia bacterium]